MKKLLFIYLIALLSLCGCFDATKKNQSSEQKKSPITFLSKEIFPGDMSKNAIYSVMLHNGEIWLGTASGVYQQSLDFEPERHYLANNKIIKLAASNNQIYALSEKNGLFALSANETEFYHTGSSRVRDIVVEPKQDIVYCATSHGIDVLENATWSNIKIQATHRYKSKANDLTAISLDTKGKLWIGTSFGVYKMNTQSSFTFLYGDYQIIEGDTVINRQGNSPLGGNLIYQIWCEQKSGSLFLSTNGGLSVLKDTNTPNSKTNWKVYTGDHTKSVMNNDGKISSREIKGNSPLTTNFIKTAINFNEHLYIGSEFGLTHLHNNQWTNYSMDDHLLGDHIYSLFLDETASEYVLYIGTNGGLSVFRHTKQTT